MCDYVNAKFTRLARLLLRTLIPLTRVFIIPNHMSFRAPNFRLQVAVSLISVICNPLLCINSESEVNKQTDPVFLG